MSSLRVTARRVLDDAWRPNGGYASPNLATYPWQWLWDSCFHALIWARVGDGRAVTELESLFRWQTSQGFVPHMGYQEDPRAAVELWGQPGASTITQPPMWGHAARLVTESGFSLSSDLLERMWQGFEWLWRHRMRDDILVLVHPWESGCDDSARWRPTTRTEWDRPAWKRAKLALLQTLEVDDRAAVANPAWEVGSAGFNAVVAFNVRELLTVDARPAWATRVAALEAALFRRFDADLGTWTDDPPSEGHAVPTLDALLPALVDLNTDLGRLLEPFDAEYGPAYVPPTHASFDPDQYWRGPAWPQLTYLLWLAAQRRRDEILARSLGKKLIEGALASDWSEYWNPSTGQGRGAKPQSWTGLAALVE